MTEILTESFCERCGTRYTFESARPRVRLKGVRVLSRGLKNFVLSDSTSMDEAMAAARSETDRDSTAHQLDAFHKTFNFCMSCRQYTCPNCWNDAEARCLTCAPLALPEAPAFDDVGAFRDAIQLSEATLIGEVAETNGLPDHDHEQEVASAPFVADASVAEAPSWLEAPAAAEEPELAEPGVAEGAPAALVADDATPGADAWSDDGIPAEQHEAPVAEAPMLADERLVAEDAQLEEHAAPAAPSDDAAGKAAAQTTGLLQRFRPGQSLDDALAAFERERSDAETPVEQAEIAASGAMEPTPESELEPVLVDAAKAADAAEPEAVAEPIEAIAEPEPVAEPIGVDAAAEAAPEEIGAAELPPIEADTEVPAQTPVAVPEAEPEPLAAASAEDVVEQPTWRITAPDPTAPTAPRLPTGGDAGVPLQAGGASSAPAGEPQWPAKPQWPGSTPAAGLPFLGRPAAPQGGIDALWAASNQELVTAAPAPQSKAASGIQPCISCGLSLSANARFCRRCGTLQGR